MFPKEKEPGEIPAGMLGRHPAVVGAVRAVTREKAVLGLG